jgi:hypothetical protein
MLRGVGSRTIRPLLISAGVLLTGVLLHDLGKTWELSSDTSFEYTDEGQLLGHILLGIQVLERKIAAISDFPEELAMLIKHVVADLIWLSGQSISCLRPSERKGFIDEPLSPLLSQIVLGSTTMAAI